MDETGMIMNVKRIVVALSAMALANFAAAAVKRGPDMTLEQLTKKSDAIVLGTCKAKQARWVAGRIETDYEVEVKEALKGEKSFRAGTTFRMTVMGGESTTPPVTQYTEMQAHMYVGENVALFLRTGPAGSKASRDLAASRGSNLYNTPRVVGMNEGKFSVITDKRDGRQKLTRFHMESYGFTPNDKFLEKFLDSIAAHKVKTTSGTVTAKDTNTSGVAVSGRSAPIPVQDLEDFKSQVRQYLN